MRERARVDPPEIIGQRLARDVGDRPGHLDAGCAAADDDEGEQPLPLGVVVRELGSLECQENAAANAGRVLDALEPRRDRSPTRRDRNRSASRPVAMTR